MNESGRNALIEPGRDIEIIYLDWKKIKKCFQIVNKDKCFPFYLLLSAE